MIFGDLTWWYSVTTCYNCHQSVHKEWRATLTDGKECSNPLWLAADQHFISCLQQLNGCEEIMKCKLQGDSLSNCVNYIEQSFHNFSFWSLMEFDDCEKLWDSRGICSDSSTKDSISVCWYVLQIFWKWIWIRIRIRVQLQTYIASELHFWDFLEISEVSKISEK